MERGVNFIIGNPRRKDLAKKKPRRKETDSSTTVLAADQSSLLFSLLPKDIILNCLARVPRRDCAIVSCVSKRFRSLVHSPELAHMRSLLGKDLPTFYVCFVEPLTSLRWKFRWLSYNPNENQTNGHIQVLSQQKLYCSTVSIGSKIYFVGGSLMDDSSDLWIFDSWTGKLCKGPSMKGARMLPGVAVVDGEIYVMGGCIDEQIKVEIFNLKNQTWKVRPVNPHREDQYGFIVSEAVGSEGKFHGIRYNEGNNVIYDPKDGTCDTFKMANEKTWSSGGVCVINDVIYANYSDVGVMWYDSKDKVWRMVQGLEKLVKPIYISVGMLDCNGKIAFLWEDEADVNGEKPEKRIWCTMIVLDRSGVEIHGTVERSHLIGSVPCYYRLCRCLGVSN